MHGTGTRVSRASAYAHVLLSSFITSRTPSPFTVFDAYNAVPLFYPESTFALYYFPPETTPRPPPLYLESTAAAPLSILSSPRELREGISTIDPGGAYESMGNRLKRL